jgi:hypothetical protein
MDQSIKKVSELMSRNFDELAAALAKGENTIVFGSSETPPERDRNLGRALFDQYSKQLKETICTDARVMEFLRRDAQLNEAEVITTVMDLVITSLGGVPVLVLTAMILKYSLKRLCSEQAT